MKNWISIVVVLPIFVGLISFVSGEPSEEEILKSLLSRSYDKRVRPKGRNGTGPVIATTNFYVRNIEEINDVKMDFTVQLTFRQQWVDRRLQFAYSDEIPYITLTDTNDIWMPDTFFSSEKTSHRHTLLSSNSYLRIFPDGTVLHSTRITLTSNCPMSLSRLPFDTQTCVLKIASYGFTADHLIFLWKKDDPVQVTKDLHISNWQLKTITTDYCDSQTSTGTYSCIKATFEVSRDFNNYLIDIYIPTAMLVILSWTSFWLDHRSVTGRLFMGISALLVAAIQTSNFNEHLPRVPYTKAIDVYTGVSLTFIFMSILEFCTVHYLSRFDEDLSATPQESKRCWSRISESYCYEKLDILSRLLFPMAFAIFIAIYHAYFCVEG